MGSSRAIEEMLPQMIAIFPYTMTGHYPRKGLKKTSSAFPQLAALRPHCVNQYELVRALAAFIKKSRELEVPGWVDTIELAKHNEFVLYSENCFHTRAVPTALHLWPQGSSGVGSRAQSAEDCGDTASSTATSAEPPRGGSTGSSKQWGLGELKMVGKNQDGDGTQANTSGADI